MKFVKKNVKIFFFVIVIKESCFIVEDDIFFLEKRKILRIDSICVASKWLHSEVFE